MNRRPSPLRATLASLLLACLPFGAAVAGGSATAIAAAQKAATGAAACTSLGDFYWVIGDATGTIADGSVGSGYDANTEMKIFSASKWIWGAYVVQKQSTLDQDQLDALEMESGFTAQNPLACLFTRTVGDCFRARKNSTRDGNTIGHFYYNGGHAQKMAVDMGLGGAGPLELTGAIFSELGRDIGLRYGRAQLASGIEGSATEYGNFLRKIVRGELKMHDFLGYKPVCTLPRACPGALSSPVKEAWHYSLHHWVEDAPGVGDGAFSSPGLAGFYPWISADKKTWGILAREKQGLSSYWDSVQCGREIRKAYLSSAAP